MDVRHSLIIAWVLCAIVASFGRSDGTKCIFAIPTATTVILESEHDIAIRGIPQNYNPYQAGRSAVAFQVQSYGNTVQRDCVTEPVGRTALLPQGEAFI